MGQQSATARQRKQSKLDGLFVPPHSIDEHIRDIVDLISRRAYETFESRGAVHGHDCEDWYDAESALLQAVANEVSDSGDAFTVVVDISAYRPQDLKISVEPQSLRICGRADDEYRASDIPADSLPYPRAFSLSYQFPAPIDPVRASAETRPDVLEVRLPKTNPSPDPSPSPDASN